MRRIISALLGAAALITAYAAVPAQAAVTAPAGPVVLGSVLAAGQPVAGAEVTLYAWPDQAVTSAMTDGQQVPLVAVGQAVSSSTGVYGVPVSNYAALQARADNGIVNLIAVAVSGQMAATFSFSRRLAANGTELVAVGNAPTPSKAPQTATLNLAAGPNTPGVQCGIMHLLHTYPPRNVVVGATFSRVSGETTSFVYGGGQSSSLGVGISDGNGTFHASGTHSASSTTSQSWAAQSGAVSTRYRTKFTFGLYAVQCAPNQVQVIRWDGGATIQRTTAPRATWCLLYNAGSTFTKHTTSAYTFSGGAQVSADIGINLSAHTGYSTTAELRYHQVRAHYLCGTNGYVAGTPKRIVAGLPA